MNDEHLTTTLCEKDLGVLIYFELKFHDRTAAIVSKANHLLAIVKISF